MDATVATNLVITEFGRDPPKLYLRMQIQNMVNQRLNRGCIIFLALLRIAITIDPRFVIIRVLEFEEMHIMQLVQALIHLFIILKVFLILNAKEVVNQLQINGFGIDVSMY